MSNPKPLADAVMLYHRAGCPEWSNRQFRGELDYAESRELLDRLHKQPEKDGRLNELKVDGQQVLGREELPATGERATFAFNTSLQDGVRFFRSVAELAGDYRPLGRGKFPDRFYLVEEDYQHGETETSPDTVQNLIELTRFAAALAELADHKYDTEGTRAWTLVFRTKDGLGLLETRFGKELLGVKVPSVAREVVEGLRSGSDGTHQKEKRWMFRATMCEFLKDGVSFREFVECGVKWADAYENDLQTYLSGFSFEEVRRKIAEEHARFAEQVSTILGSITVKVLSLPLSVAAAMILKTQAAGLPWWFPVLLLTAVGGIIARLVGHYQRVVPRVEQNIDMVFGKMKTRDPVVHPKELDNNVKEVVESLQNEIGKLRTTLRIYWLAAWAVPVIGVVMLISTDDSFVPTAESAARTRDACAVCSAGESREGGRNPESERRVKR